MFDIKKAIADFQAVTAAIEAGDWAAGMHSVGDLWHDAAAAYTFFKDAFPRGTTDPDHAALREACGKLEAAVAARCKMPCEGEARAIGDGTFFKIFLENLPGILLMFKNIFG